MEFIDVFTAALRTQGHKITKNRTAILEFLSHLEKPISADEILHHVQEEHQAINTRVLVSPFLNELKTPNKTTIYRELFFLLEHNFIREVEFGDGKKRYEITINRPHHHHIICINCKRVEDIPLESELDHLKSQIEHLTKYKLTSHMLEFFGVCANCQ